MVSGAGDHSSQRGIPCPNLPARWAVSLGVAECRGNLVSAVAGQVLIRPPAHYVAVHDTSPPEDQVVQTDPVSILRRCLLQKTKREQDKKKQERSKAAAERSKEKGKAAAKPTADKGKRWVQGRGLRLRIWLWSAVLLDCNWGWATA